MKLILQHLFNRWLSAGATWVFNTGFAYSLPVSEYFYERENGEPVPVTNYGSKNQFRMPLYHRLDVSARATFQTKRLEHTFNVGVYNAYNRRNPLYYNVRTRLETQGEELKERKEYVQVWLLPILPSVSYGIRF
jgi:hypothetical protein